MNIFLLGLLHEKDLCVAQLCEDKMRIIIDLMVIHIFLFCACYQHVKRIFITLTLKAIFVIP